MLGFVRSSILVLALVVCAHSALAEPYHGDMGRVTDDFTGLVANNFDVVGFSPSEPDRIPEPNTFLALVEVPTPTALGQGLSAMTVLAVVVFVRRRRRNLAG